MSTLSTGKKALTGAVCLAVFISGRGWADDFDPATQVKLRQGFMQTQKRQLVELTAVAKGEAPFSDDTVQRAENMRNLALIIPDAFALRSDLERVEGTRALPALWERPAERNKLIKRLRAETARLAQEAQAKDRSRLAAQLKRVSGVCKNCHDDFRKPKEQSQ